MIYLQAKMFWPSPKIRKYYFCLETIVKKIKTIMMRMNIIYNIREMYLLVVDEQFVSLKIYLRHKEKNNLIQK
jgi:hypothetical protein